MLKKKKTTASGKLVLVKSVRRHWTSGRCPFSADRSGTETAQPQKEFLCSKGLGGIACLFSFQISRTTLSVLSPFPGCDATGCHAFWRTAGIKHFHLIDTLILQGNIWIYKRI
mgnify:CR=1 FL=1